MMRQRVSRLRQRSENQDRSSGAVLIESAIVITLILTMFFGVLEFGMLLRSRHVLAEATRTGARAASSLPRQDGYKPAAAEAVGASLRCSIPSTSVVSLVVYKADPITGLPVSGTLDNCYRFDWDAVAEKFDVVGGYSWAASDQDACGDVGNTDYVGVALTGTHDFVTSFWSDSVGIADRTVMRLEPVIDSAICS